MNLRKCVDATIDKGFDAMDWLSDAYVARVPKLIRFVLHPFWVIIENRDPTDDEALVMEAFDHGQFAADTLGIGGSNRGLAEPVRAALHRMLTKRYAELYGPGRPIAAQAANKE